MPRIDGRWVDSDGWPDHCTWCGRGIGGHEGSPLKNLSRRTDYGGQNSLVSVHCGQALCKTNAQNSVDAQQVMEHAEHLDRMIRNNAALLRTEGTRNDFVYNAVLQMSHLGMLCIELRDILIDDWNKERNGAPLFHHQTRSAGPLLKAMTHPDTWPHFVGR